MLSCIMISLFDRCTIWQESLEKLKLFCTYSSNPVVIVSGRPAILDLENVAQNTKEFLES